MPVKFFYCTLLLILIGVDCEAQLCTGSLGDPVVSIDFGAGKRRLGPPLPPGTTNLNHQLNAYSEGSYTIANSTAGLNPGWVTTGDHTGDPGGYMMVINASWLPGIFYRQEVPGLCPGTTYEFGAWIQNILNYRAKQPNIIFQIEDLDGAILGQLQTGPLPEKQTPAWQQYALQFTTPVNQTTVVIKLINSGPGGAGNDLALDDITFRPCGSIVRSFINGSLDQLSIHEGESGTVYLSAQDSGSATDLYQWQVNTGNGWVDIAGAAGLVKKILFTNALPGNYQYRLTTGNAADLGSVQCRVASNICTVSVTAAPATAIQAKIVAPVIPVPVKAIRVTPVPVIPAPIKPVAITRLAATRPLVTGVAAINPPEVVPPPKTFVAPQDGYYKKSNIQNAKPVRYPNLRESDVPYAKRVWRDIDLRMKMNAYLASPKSRLIDVLMDAISSGELIAYDAAPNLKIDQDGDSFTVPLTREQAKNRMADSVVIDKFDKDGNKIGSAIVAGEFDPDSIVKFRLKEDWIFDKQRSVFEPRIIGIAPLVKPKSAGIDLDYQPAFWIYFPAARKVLATKLVANKHNDATGLSFDDVFLKRLFDSYITKVSNDKDERIKDHSTGIDKLYEGEKIKKGLMDWELNLWQY